MDFYSIVGVYMTVFKLNVRKYYASELLEAHSHYTSSRCGAGGVYINWSMESAEVVEAFVC